MNDQVVKKFDSFITEALSDEEREELRSRLEATRYMVDTGMLDRDQLTHGKREVLRKVGGVTKLRQDAVLGELANPELHEAMQSQEYQELLAAGWRNSATDLQTFKGTIALTTPAARNNGPNGWPTSIAVFAAGYIRRIWTGGQPQVMVGSLPNPGTADMYKAAFRWIISNINPNDPNLKTLPKRLKWDAGTGIERYGESYAKRERERRNSLRGPSGPTI